MATIHPTAQVDSSAVLADDVEVGPFSLVEPDVTIGPGTVLRSHVVIRRHTTLGAGNLVDSFAVLGGPPQDYKFDPSQVSYLKIGNGNIFREGVTVNRATGEGAATVVGDNTYWFANSHAGHNTEIRDRAILVNGTLVGGHSTVGSRAILGANGAIHQFCRIGERVMFQGGAMVGMHVPPYVLCAEVNKVISLNAVGLRRSDDMTDEDRKQIKEAFNLVYRCGHSLEEAIEKMDACADWGKAAGAFREFVRKAADAAPPFDRGLCPHMPRARGQCR